MKRRRSMWTEDLDGLQEGDIYAERVRESLLENDEINSWEHAFLEGYDRADAMMDFEEDYE